VEQESRRKQRGERREQRERPKADDAKHGLWRLFLQSHPLALLAFFAVPTK